MVDKLGIKKFEELNFTGEIVKEVVFNTDAEIKAIYVYLENEFTTEQELEVYYTFGNDSHKGTEVYDKIKKRYTIRPSDMVIVGSLKDQKMYFKLTNTLAEINSAYFTIIYKV